MVINGWECVWFVYILLMYLWDISLEGFKDKDFGFCYLYM